MHKRIPAEFRRHIAALVRHLGVLDATVAVAALAALAAAAAFAVWLFGGATIVVTNGDRGERIGPASGTFTGQPCAGAGERPIAVMLASDPEARPLSGIAEADMVIEMPVTPNGITRMMAVYQCGMPREVGSIRSARMDFIPLAVGLQAVYAHWGGERDALALLDAGTADNVDALKYEGTVYYRKPKVPRPHNGFTTLEALREKAADLGYPASASLTPYVHSNQEPERNLASMVTEVTMDWPQGMDVAFRYDQERNRYLRWRGGKPETDALDGRQVAVAAVIVLRTDATPSYDQYLSVRTLGEGVATVFQGGRRMNARWKKGTASDMLAIIDARGNPVPLTPGPVWMLVDAPLPSL